jgi:hypothetical protein
MCDVRGVLLAVGLALGTGPLLSAEECPVFLSGIETGIPQAGELNEISGMAASRRSPGVLWVHNDSGNDAAVYAVRSDGVYLGKYVLPGAHAVDWEDMAIGPGPSLSSDYLYIGDTGDNVHARPFVRVYRIPEPPVSPDQEPVVRTSEPPEVFTLYYPGEPPRRHDCETLLVDPLSGEIFLVTKDNTGADGGDSLVYRVPTPYETLETLILEEVARIHLGSSLVYLVTGGDIAPQRNLLALRTYGLVWIWNMAPGQSLAEAFLQPPCSGPAAGEPQGEALAFADAGYFTTSEWTGFDPQPIYYYAQEQEYEGEPLEPECLNARGGIYEAGQEFCLGVPGPVSPVSSFQWYREGVALENDGRIRGAHQRSLSISPAQSEDTGTYTCRYQTLDKAEQWFGPVYVVVGESLPAVGFVTLAMGLVLVTLLASIGWRRRRASV